MGRAGEATKSSVPTTKGYEDARIEGRGRGSCIHQGNGRAKLRPPAVLAIENSWMVAGCKGSGTDIKIRYQPRAKQSSSWGDSSSAWSCTTLMTRMMLLE